MQAGASHGFMTLKQGVGRKLKNTRFYLRDDECGCPGS